MIEIVKPGWHARGYHPHFDANTLLQHVVFRTAGSLPNYVMEQTSAAVPQLKRGLIDDALDRSSLGKTFSEPKFAEIMQSALRFFDGDRYDLQAWCVMPNHIHVVLVTSPDVLLGRIVKSWKYKVALDVNRLKNKNGPVFAKDYFDRFIRNVRQAETAIHYVEANPVKAHLCDAASDWPWSSAFFRAQGWVPRHDRLPVFLD
jgi:putative transposase